MRDERDDQDPTPEPVRSLPAPLPLIYRCRVDQSGGLADDTCQCEDCR